MEDKRPSMIDVAAPTVVEIVIQFDGKAAWVNVDGRCLFCAHQIELLILDDWRKNKDNIW